MPPAIGSGKAPLLRWLSAYVLAPASAGHTGVTRVDCLSAAYVHAWCITDAVRRPGSPVMAGREELRVAAALIIVLVSCALAVGSVLAARWCLRALRRRRERRTWDELVIRHRNLDRELERIWRSR